VSVECLKKGHKGYTYFGNCALCMNLESIEHMTGTNEGQRKFLPSRKYILGLSNEKV
jgi:hypothetical protein